MDCEGMKYLFQNPFDSNLGMHSENNVLNFFLLTPIIW